MIDEGLEAEVKSLMDRGYSPSLPSMGGLGYRQFIDCFSGTTSA